MSSVDEERIKLYRVRNSLLHMLRDRGYVVTDDEINMTQQQFFEQYGEGIDRNNLRMCKEMHNNSSDRILVFFIQSEPPQKTIGVKQIMNCVSEMISETVFRAILVVNTKLSPVAKKALLVPKMILEIFEEAELLVNVMDHALVPEHRVLTDEEKKELLLKYRVAENQLPRMLVTDPVAKHFGLQRGKVVKITRKSEITKKYITYRVVA